jgi:hypothetical protein
MPRVIAPGSALAAVLVACALVAGCTSSTSTSSGGGHGAALTGDGHWHVAATATQPPGFTLPRVMNVLPEPHQVVGTGPAPHALFDAKSFEEVNAEPCAATLTELTDGLSSAGFQVIGMGTGSHLTWLTIVNAAGDGVSLTLGDSGTDCFIDGIPLTPVHLQSTGTPQATGDTTAAVSCVIGTANAGPSIIVTIFGAAVQQSTFGIILVVPKPTAGTFAVGGDGGVQAGLLTTPVHSYDELSAAHPDVIASGFKTGGLMATGGTVTIADGIASGSFDLMYNGGELKGVFECGTPLFPTMPSPVPASTP